jgi:hypothetical protein
MMASPGSISTPTHAKDTKAAQTIHSRPSLDGNLTWVNRLRSSLPDENAARAASAHIAADFMKQSQCGGYIGIDHMSDAEIIQPRRIHRLRKMVIEAFGVPPHPFQYQGTSTTTNRGIPDSNRRARSWRVRRVCRTCSYHRCLTNSGMSTAMCRPPLEASSSLT